MIKKKPSANGKGTKSWWEQGGRRRVGDEKTEDELGCIVYKLPTMNVIIMSCEHILIQKTLLNNSHHKRTKLISNVIICFKELS